MYTISDAQIDYILNDIRARGVEMEDLQNNLLDHICCIIEQNLEENGDFEGFYKRTISSFYKEELWELEEETLQLLIFKHYYTMKKIMLNSGIFSSITLIIGLIFKFLYWPGASALIILGIGAGALLFLPLLFTLKAKEKQKTQEKITLLVGGVACSVLSLSILFRVLHWPYAHIIGLVALLTLLLVFLPVYLINGIRNPETKVNTITSSMMIVLGCGLMLTLIRSPKGIDPYNMLLTQHEVVNEQLLANEWKMSVSINNESNAAQKSFTQIYDACVALKTKLFNKELGVDKLNTDFEKTNLIIDDRALSLEAVNKEITDIAALIKAHNDKYIQSAFLIKHTLFDTSSETAYKFTSMNVVLNQITQIQWFALQSKNLLLANK